MNRGLCILDLSKRLSVTPWQSPAGRVLIPVGQSC
jgi:hypothetical protein